MNAKNKVNGSHVVVELESLEAQEVESTLDIDCAHIQDEVDLQADTSEEKR